MGRKVDGKHLDKSNLSKIRRLAGFRVGYFWADIEHGWADLETVNLLGNHNIIIIIFF
jgi:hypothetical protein